MNPLRAQARRLAKMNTGDPEVDILLAKLAEVTNTREWVLRAMWNQTPEYQRFSKKEELLAAIQEMESNSGNEPQV